VRVCVCVCGLAVTISIIRQPLSVRPASQQAASRWRLPGAALARRFVVPEGPTIGHESHNQDALYTVQDALNDGPASRADAQSTRSQRLQLQRNTLTALHWRTLFFISVLYFTSVSVSQSLGPGSAHLSCVWYASSLTCTTKHGVAPLKFTDDWQRQSCQYLHRLEKESKSKKLTRRAAVTMIGRITTILDYDWSRQGHVQIGRQRMCEDVW